MNNEQDKRIGVDSIPINLRQLAELHGIQLSYWDVYGNEQIASSEALLAVLRALGVQVESLSDVDPALTDYKRQLWQRCLEPVLTAWDGGSFTVDVRLPKHLAAQPFSVQITLENSRSETREIREHVIPGSELTIKESALINEASFVRKQFQLPGGLPYGYHSLTLRVLETAALESGKTTQNEYSCLIISAPREVPQLPETSRLWGGFLPLYALHSKSSWGIGDFTDLTRLADWIADQGGSMAGTLPLLPAFLPEAGAPEEPFEFSPYAPASRLFWNEIFIDIESIPDLEQCPSALKILKSRTFRRDLNSVRTAEQVDYRRVMSLKRKVLTELSKKVTRSRSKRGLAFKEYLKQHPHLTDYARFRAVVQQRGTSWQVWDDSLRKGNIKNNDYDPDVMRYHQYVQWIAEEQLRQTTEQAARRDVGLYLDLPLGVHPSGYDMYRERASFVAGASAGAPPDRLFAGGQDWGFAPLHPQRLRDQRYRYLINTLRHHLQFARYLRIDHVMGFHRLYFVPPGLDAKSGVYVTYPASEIYAIVCLEAHRTDTIIIGEDLGTVPDNVRSAMNRHALNRMHILELEIAPEAGAELPEISQNCLVGLNTHDLPTFEGFWENRDFDLQHSLGIMTAEQVGSEGLKRDLQKSRLVNFLTQQGWLTKDKSVADVLHANLRYLADSPAKMLLLNLEDLWLEPNPQNLPGTWRERANWQQKAKLRVEEIINSKQIAEIIGQVSTIRRGSISGAGQVSDNHPVETGNEFQNSQILSELDLFLFNEGSHFRLSNQLGAHPTVLGSQTGVNFAVWAPDARRVLVVGDFNNWLKDRDLSQAEPWELHARGNSGIWAGFIPDLKPGDLYKYLIIPRYGEYRLEKADPFAFQTEVPPRTASIVADLEYEWHDQSWLATRHKSNSLQAPMSIYEVHLGSWRRVPEEGNRSLSYRELAPLLIEYVLKLGYTHVEFMPITEHPFFGSWGYQTTGYFAPSARYGSPQDFMFLVDSLHQAGLGVILDWVPSHFPDDPHGLAQFDGTHLYEHADPRQGRHPDWDSCIFNYSRREVRSFLISSALFWLDQYHLDGLRIDAVASMLYLDYSRAEGAWIPNEFGGRENLAAISFLRRLNIEIYRHFPDVQTFAEESTSYPLVTRPTDVGGLGFGLKWDLGWMHDILEYLQRDPIHRQFHHQDFTFRSIYAFHENFCLPLSHDEVVHMKGSLLGKMPGDDWQKFANLRLLYAVMYGQPGKKLLFMGGEFAQRGEWNHDRSLEWHLTESESHAGIQHLIADLNRLYRSESPLYQLDHDSQGFEWISCTDHERSCYSFLRRDQDGKVIVVAMNFTPVVRTNYPIGVPQGGFWREIFNSNAEIYGGSGLGNIGGVQALEQSFEERFSFTLNVTLPPLGAVFFKLNE